jgi:ATP-dependent protease ClpP protease subunit
MAKKSWFKVAMATGAAAMAPRNAGGKVARIDILGPIGGWEVSGSEFLRELRALGDVDTIDLRIHSEGGSVLDGWAIANGIKSHPAHVVGTVGGMAASMASVVLCACDEIHVPKNGYVMIHNVSGGAHGGSDELRSVADLIDKLQDDIADFYAERSGLDKEEIIKMMSEETWMNGADALEKGFANKVLAPVKAAALASQFDLSAKFSNVPSTINVVEDEDEEEAPEEAEEAPEEAPEEAEEPSAFGKILALLNGKAGKGSSASNDAAALLERKTLKASIAELEVKIAAAEVIRDAAQAKADKLELEAKTVEAALVEAGFDFAGTGELPVPLKGNADSSEVGDILGEMSAMPMGPKRDEFFAANEPAIMAAYSARAKSGR